MVTYQGRTMCLSAWAEELGLKYSLVRDRIVERGWSPEAAFNTVVGGKKFGEEVD